MAVAERRHVHKVYLQRKDEVSYEIQGKEKSNKKKCACCKSEVDER